MELTPAPIARPDSSGWARFSIAPASGVSLKATSEYLDIAVCHVLDNFLPTWEQQFKGEHHERAARELVETLIRPDYIYLLRCFVHQAIFDEPKLRERPEPLTSKVFEIAVSTPIDDDTANDEELGDTPKIPSFLAAAGPTTLVGGAIRGRFYRGDEIIGVISREARPLAMPRVPVFPPESAQSSDRASIRVTGAPATLGYSPKLTATAIAYVL
jgi:hypothetical protein